MQDRKKVIFEGHDLQIWISKTHFLKVIFEGQFWINLNLPVTNSVIFPVFTPVSSVNKKQRLGFLHKIISMYSINNNNKMNQYV